MSEETLDHVHDEETPTTLPSEPKIKFGFAVLVTDDGNVYVERNSTSFTFEVERDASLLEVRRYASELLMDLQAQSAAEYVTLRLNALDARSANQDTPTA